MSEWAFLEAVPKVPMNDMKMNENLSRTLGGSVAVEGGVRLAETCPRVVYLSLLLLPYLGLGCQELNSSNLPHPPFHMDSHFGNHNIKINQPFPFFIFFSS